MTSYIQPWKIKKEYYSIYNKRHNARYSCSKEVINDINVFWNRGDIIQFGSSYKEKCTEDWTDWFLTNDEDKQKFLKRNYRIPLYAHNQYGIILCRYKIKKDKGFYKYNDYGSYIMILTGSKLGKVRKYFGSGQYYFISTFPYEKILLPEEVNEAFEKFNVNNLSKKLNLKHGNTPKARTIFIDNLQKKIIKEAYNEQ